MGAIKNVLSFPFKKVVITRVDGQPYLIRWHLVRSRWGTIMLHKILLSDEGCPHDHPWSFTSIMLHGSYMELEYKKDLIVGARSFIAPCIIRRPAEWTHKLLLRKPCWTLVITSTYKRKWGFWTPRGWLRHNDYTPRKICDE